jgi:Fic family protein
MARQSHPRAGRYIQQPTGYQAFIPASIPPEPALQFDSELVTAISKAELALGRLDGAAQILPNPDLFVLMYVRKEAVLSSQIEGTQASLVDVLQFEAAMEDGKPRDMEEVINYVGAMNYGLRRLRDFPISLRLIREIHAALLSGVRGSDRNPGEFRTFQNWIGPSGCTLNDAEFVPPPPHQMMQALDNLERFLHASIPMPQLMKAGIAHAQFETIHPFLDGNGRVGRLLITFLLCQQGILQYPLLYLSHYFKQHRSEYYELLQSIRESGDWESWLKFFLKGVDEVSQEAAATAKQIVRLREEHREIVQKALRRGAAKGLVLLEMLYHRPIVSVKQAAAEVKLTFKAANDLIGQFVELGILAETSGRQRNRLFGYESYLALFKPGTEP